MLENLVKHIETNLKFTSVVILCIVSTLVLMPIMAEVTINFHTVILNGVSDTESTHLTTPGMNTVGEMYIPPNYGAPNSQHGSGTR